MLLVLSRYSEANARCLKLLLTDGERSCRLLPAPRAWPVDIPVGMRADDSYGPACTGAQQVAAVEMERIPELGSGTPAGCKASM